MPQSNVLSSDDQLWICHTIIASLQGAHYYGDVTFRMKDGRVTVVDWRESRPDEAIDGIAARLQRARYHGEVAMHVRDGRIVLIDYHQTKTMEELSKGNR